MLQKLVQRLTTKMFPYWCPYCPRRYHFKSKFHQHYLRCEGRLAAQARENEMLEKIKPRNRAQRRRMAKKAGQIKDWDKLNAP